MIQAICFEQRTDTSVIVLSSFGAEGNNTVDLEFFACLHFREIVLPGNSRKLKSREYYQIYSIMFRFKTARTLT